MRIVLLYYYPSNNPIIIFGVFVLLIVYVTSKLSKKTVKPKPFIDPKLKYVYTPPKEPKKVENTIVMNGSELYYVENDTVRIKLNLIVNDKEYLNYKDSNPMLPVKYCNGVNLIKYCNDDFNVLRIGSFIKVISLVD